MNENVIIAMDSAGEVMAYCAAISLWLAVLWVIASNVMTAWRTRHVVIAPKPNNAPAVIAIERFR